jgi:hypothetical protein
MPRCRNRVDVVYARYSDACVEGCKDGDVRIECRKHLFPERIAPSLLHISRDFQATSVPERAFDSLETGGILSIKARITKNVLGHIHLDGVDHLYMNYLDHLFGDIEERYREAIEWTTFDRLATSLSASCPTSLIENAARETAADRAA